MEHAADGRLGLEPRCQVDDVADEPVLAMAASGADEAGMDLAARHADAEARPVIVPIRRSGGSSLQE